MGVKGGRFNMNYLLCDSCAMNEAKHITWSSDEEFHQCCGCYIIEGNPPVDWHPDCMKTYNELKNTLVEKENK